MVPLVAIGGSDDGVAPSPDVILEGIKLGEVLIGESGRDPLPVSSF